jgi:3-deoxy-7-phosphoheptulonate synthase
MSDHDLAVDRLEDIDDCRIRAMRELDTPLALLFELPIARPVAELVRSTRRNITAILAAAEPRLLAVVGPCSVHDVPAALEYARWIARARATFGDQLEIVMRVYFEKPRTRNGWKGMINDPHLDGTFQMSEGLRIARRLLLDINAMGVPTATEFVDPITPQYLGDLISWAAIGARTAESQVHRELASGLSCPVGFKNSTSGDVSIAINAVVAASRAHSFMGVNKRGRPAIVSTTGNADCHVILRGGARPNFDEASVAAASAGLARERVCPRVMIDCSHGNCEGDYRRQLEVATEVARQRSAGSDRILGIMVESNILEGRQVVVAGRAPVGGLSVTDPCLGLADTALLLGRLAGQPAIAG